MRQFYSLLPITGAMRWRLALGLFLACVAALANFGLLFLSGWLLAGAAFAGAAGMAAQQAFNMMLPAAGVRFFATLRILSRYAERLVTHDTALQLIDALRAWTYGKLAPLAPAGVNDKRGGDLLSRFVTDTDQMGQYYTDTLLPFVRAGVCCAVAIGITTIFLKTAAVWLIAASLVCGVAVPFVTGRLSDALLARVATEQGVQQADLAETLQSLGDYLTLGAAERQQEHILRQQRALMAAQRKLAALEGAAKGIITLCATGTTLAVLISAVEAFQNHALSLPEVPMLVLGSLATFDVLAPLPAARQTWGRIRLAATRLHAACAVSPLVPTPAIPAQAQPPYNLKLDNVSFRYPETHQWILHKASLSIRQGERVALIGPSGSGKSSLISVLFRFYPYQEGKISFSGMDLCAFQAETLAQNISVAAQNFHLFNGSLRDNLLLAAPHATEADLRDALRVVQLHAFVARAPQGLDTLIGNDGLKLSGGQAKRLTIAQALLRKTPWLILDEPTEGLDAETETALMTSLLKARPDATLLCITHRRAVLPFMDRAIRIENGAFQPAEEARA